MNILGVIAEYNPFHSGHHFQLQQAQALTNADCTVIVMSGHFTQRGEPTIFDKWLRTEMALSGGADLVLELPLVFAARSAYYFALGGVLSLAAAQVTHLAFGAETDRLADLQAVASLLTIAPESFHALRQKHLDQGLSFPKAQHLAVQALLPDQAYVLSSPNNLLAIHYLQILQQYQLPIKPVLIQRRGAAHNSLAADDAFISATAIRQLLLTHDPAWQQYVPSSSAAIINAALANGHRPTALADFTQSILLLLRRSTPEALSILPESGEGLVNRLWQAGQASADLSQLCAAIKSKRYTYTRIQRLLCYLLLGLDQTDTACRNPLYLRLLGFNTTGRHWLHQLKKRSSLPLITKTASAFAGLSSQGQAMLTLDCRATDVYDLAHLCSQPAKGGQDFYRGPIISIK